MRNKVENDINNFSKDENISITVLLELFNEVEEQLTVNLIESK